MMRYLFAMTFSVFVLLAQPVVRAADPDGYFQQFVHYTIKARLDAENHMLKGSEMILYKNNSPDTLHEFYLHLYPNAFRSKNSTLLKDYRRGYNFSLMDIPEKYRGFLEIDELTIDGEKVAPHIDDTIAQMKLPAPLLPGDSMKVEIAFREKIRQHLGRAGYRGKHYDFAQWYPKVVVYDEKGFHPDKHGRGEFYGEFGTYDVQLDVPENYVVAATGMVVEGDPGWELNHPSGKAKNESRQGGDDYKTVHFHAENVHDFAWSADPNFVVQDTTWNGIEIRSFYQKKHKTWKDSTLIHGIRALEWLSQRVGPYPYPQLSIVDALLSGGMEYPMLVMNGKVSEGLVLHEVGHIYFYGLFGNDERAEAWLDEGFTSFQTGWYMNEKYGPWGKKKDWTFYHRITPQYTLMEQARREVFNLCRGKYGERVATRAEEFNHSYRTHVYKKAALILQALRYVVGEETFDQILREYFRRWKFHHVNEERFRKVCEDVSGHDLGWFFKEWLHSKKICDYKLDEMKVVKNKDNDTYLAGITIKRTGEIVMPLKLVFIYKNGDKETFKIDGKLRTITKTFDLNRKPVAARLNPENEIMDINLSDNFLPRRHNLQFDWPNNNYHPEDAYQIRYRPGIWYNDIDGLKAGLHLDGSYMKWLRNISLGVYYGFESERLDFSASLVKRVRFFGNNGTVSLSGYKMEGRQDATLSLWLRRRKYLMSPPNHDIYIGFKYHELTNPRFIEDKESYETEPDVGPFFGYSIDPQLDIMSTKATVKLKLGRKWGGGEFHYEKFSGSLLFRTRRELVHVSARLRFFLGLIGGNMPYQQKFHLAGGGPLSTERRFYLRSPGAAPKDLNYHQAGDGNLRGYWSGDFGVNKLFAMNLELDSPLPLLQLLTRKLLGRINATAFLDIGRSFDDVNPIQISERIANLTSSGILEKTLMDAGVGFRASKRFPFYNMTLRLDFPFYVNHPEINGEKDKVDYRYIFSLSGTF